MNSLSAGDRLPEPHPCGQQAAARRRSCRAEERPRTSRSGDRSEGSTLLPSRLPEQRRSCRHRPRTARSVAWQMPSPPIFCLGVVTEKIPLFQPVIHSAPRLSLQTRRAPWRGTGGSDGPASLEIDLTEVVPGKRGEEHLAIERICNPVRTGTAGRIEDRHRARLRDRAGRHAVLPREPDLALAIENRRVQVCVAPLLGKREECRSCVAGSTRTIAFCPPSVTQAAPSGPTMTPWAPRLAQRDQIRFAGPRIYGGQVAADCAVNRTVPSAAGSDIMARPRPPGRGRSA